MRGIKLFKGIRDCFRKWREISVFVVFVLFCYVYSRWSWILRWSGWYREIGNRLIYEVGGCIYGLFVVFMVLRICFFWVRMVFWDLFRFFSFCWWCWYGVYGLKKFFMVNLGLVDRIDSKLGFICFREVILFM